jgi:RHS repeat-associated protein
MIHRFTLFAALLGLGLSARATDPDYSQYEIKTWSTATHDVMVDGLLESSQTDALGNTSKSRSDAAGRTRISIDAAGNSSTAFFDANGNLVQSRDALNHGQNCSYDALNRRTSCADTQELAEGKSRSTTYNASGAVLTQVDTKSAVTSNSYDLRDRLVSITERNTGLVSFAYDAKGQRTSVTDQLGKVTSYQFNPRGELIKTINADASVDETVFDALGRKIKVIHPGGNNAVMAYDLASRLLSRNYFAVGSGIAESTDSFTYDLASRPLTANNADALISYAYDSIGRRSSLTQTVDGLAKTVNFVYDAANRLLSRSPEGLAVESRTFTNRGQLASVSLGAPHADAGLLASFTYDAAGRETSRTYGNGLTTTSGYSRADNLITSITVANKPELSFNYSYDSNKNVTAEQRGGSMALYSWNATFDNMDRLNSQNDGTQTRSWNLDLIGNTTSETLDGTAEARTLNDMHAPTAAGNKAYSYDSNGQMTAKPGYTLVWDARNHLVLSTGLAGILPGPVAPVAYRYDAFGNRVSKGSTRYLLVDNQVLAEFTGSTSKQYCYGSYIDEVLAEHVVSPSLPTPSLPAYYYRNRQYNTVALTNSSGAILEQYSTDAMGRVKAFDAAGSVTNTSLLATNVLFTGRVFDAETGLYYFRARYFEPELGVFVSRDPLGFVDGFSVFQGWFNYTFNNDPTGLFSASGFLMFDAKIVELGIAPPALPRETSGVRSELARKASIPSTIPVCAGSTTFKISNTSNDAFWGPTWQLQYDFLGRVALKGVPCSGKKFCIRGEITVWLGVSWVSWDGFTPSVNRFLLPAWVDIPFDTCGAKKIRHCDSGRDTLTVSTPPVRKNHFSLWMMRRAPRLMVKGGDLWLSNLNISSVEVKGEINEEL